MQAADSKPVFGRRILQQPWYQNSYTRRQWGKEGVLRTRRTTGSIHEAKSATPKVLTTFFFCVKQIAKGQPRPMSARGSQRAQSSLKRLEGDLSIKIRKGPRNLKTRIWSYRKTQTLRCFTSQQFSSEIDRMSQQKLRILGESEVLVQRDEIVPAGDSIYVNAENSVKPVCTAGMKEPVMITEYLASMNLSPYTVSSCSCWWIGWPELTTIKLMISWCLSQL